MTEPRKTMRRRFSDEFKRTAVARVAEGESIPDVARSMDIDSSLIHHWRHVANGTVKRRPATRRLVVPKESRRATRLATPELVEAVLADLDAGLAWAEISARNGVAQPTIYRWAKKSGRYLYGENAVVETIDDEVGRSEWWRRIRNVDDRTALIAIRALKRGTTKSDLMRETGWPEWTAQAFAEKARAYGGYPDLLARTSTGKLWTSEDEKVIPHLDLGLVAPVPSGRPGHPQETIAHVLALHAEGRSMRSLSREFGIKDGVIAQWRDRAMGKPKRIASKPTSTRGPRVQAPPGGFRRPDIQEKIEMLRELAGGARKIDVMTRHGVSYRTILRLMHLSPSFEVGKAGAVAASVEGGMA